MKKNVTELVFILDQSGSMQGLEKDTVGGFNSLLRRHQQEEGEAYVSTVLFNSRSQVLHDRLDIQKVPPMTERDYCAAGCTALLDAVGDAIHHIGNIHKYARSEDVPDHTIFVITTDGMENASHRYTGAQVRRMVEEKKALGWEFLFLGANIDAVEAARHIGIDEDRAVRYHSDAKGTFQNYRSLSEAIHTMRSNQPLTACWKAEIEEDYENRKSFPKRGK